MGADIKQLRIRIKSVDSTLHLTKAMGLVASSKIRRAVENMNRSRRYDGAMKQVIDDLILLPDCDTTPYLKEPEGETRIVVIAGDRGLAGGYNANVFRLVKEYPEAKLIPIGKRSVDRFGEGFQSAEGFSYEDASSLAYTLCEDFLSGKFARLGVLYTHYQSMMTQEARIRWVFPLQKPEEGKSAAVDFEPDALTVLHSAMPVYLTGLLIACVRESFASEVAARRFAMDSAGKNAQKMLDDLGLQYNRARQGAITQEITEIVAGAGSF